MMRQVIPEIPCELAVLNAVSSLSHGRFSPAKAAAWTKTTHICVLDRIGGLEKTMNNSMLT